MFRILTLVALLFLATYTYSQGDVTVPCNQEISDLLRGLVPDDQCFRLTETHLSSCPTQRDTVYLGSSSEDVLTPRAARNRQVCCAACDYWSGCGAWTFFTFGTTGQCRFVRVSTSYRTQFLPGAYGGRHR